MTSSYPFYRLLVSLVLSAVSSSFAGSIEKPILVLTSKENGLESDTTFRCQNTIHGYIVLPYSYQGPHPLESIWTAPKGLVVEHSKSTLDCGKGRQTAYVFLEFAPAMSGLWGPVPEQGNNAVFSGLWEVEVRWDHKTLLKEKFNVTCS